MLLTEKEYSEEIQNILKKFVGKEYNINVEEQALGNLAMLGEINWVIRKSLLDFI